jgi:hypothetical protein
MARTDQMFRAGLATRARVALRAVTRSILLASLLSAAFAAAEAQSPADAPARAGGTRVIIRADNRSRTIVTTVGRTVEVRLFSIGPAMYDTLPPISSDALVFIDVDAVPPFVPAGPVLRFRFRAVRAGRAIVTFTRRMPALTTANGIIPDSVVSIVEDTFQVRPRRRL